MDYKFQINLRGIIDLLSQHLYSGPHVYLRELLQNAVDAIRARTYHQPGHKGEITVEVLTSRERLPTLHFTDNGIGLNEEEIHRFLATIGQTSKKAEFWDRPTDFIGQFGIGLLSCFVVSDEITVITRSALAGGQIIEWRGKPDGTYTIKTWETSIEPGTQVYLACKKGCEDYFEPDRVRELLQHFGALLPFPIRLVRGKDVRILNDEPTPWRRKFNGPREQTAALIEYGRQVFDETFFDAIPLRSAVGEADGVAFVLPYSPNLATKRTHRVYLKNMLLSENADNLLPDWAFFVKCIVNANDLRPMASRESFYEDEKLEQTRTNLGRCLRDYLVHMAQQDPTRLQRLIAIHALSIKALAVQDDEFYRLFIDWLPFETSMGEMTLGEYRKQNEVIRYVAHLDQFRQIARVASAQAQCVINGAYVYNAELLAKFAEVFPEEQVEIVDPESLTQSFEELTLDEQEQAFAFLKLADVVLQPFRCGADMKKYQPHDLPTLYSTSADAGFLRSLEQSREVATGLWSGVLDRMSSKAADEPYARLCFNFSNPLVRRLTRVQPRKVLQRSIQMLYVQALLLGHHPLNGREMNLLNEGLLNLIEWGVEAHEGEKS